MRIITVMRHNMRVFKFYIFILFCSLIQSCSNHTKKPDDEIKFKKVETVIYNFTRADSSKYQLSIPDNYIMTEEKRKDMQYHFDYPADTMIYVLHPYDSSNYTIGTFNFERIGDSISPLYESKVIKDSVVSKMLLGKQSTWKIYEYSHGSLTAETIFHVDDSLKLHSLLYGNSTQQLDTLINILQSLKRIQ
jgi:hypothetical protein